MVRHVLYRDLTLAVAKAVLLLGDLSARGCARVVASAEQALLALRRRRGLGAVRVHPELARPRVDGDPDRLGWRANVDCEAVSLPHLPSLVRNPRGPALTFNQVANR